MLLFALTGFLIGLLLGGLTVAALIPASIFVVALAAGTFAINGGGEAFGPRMLETVLLVAGLQVGYLAGTAMRFLLLEPAIRAAKLLWATRSRSNSAGINAPLSD